MIDPPSIKDRLDLSGDWRLIRLATGESFPAPVPGDTHSALISAGKIPDPYAGMNELEVQWVGREDWAYERSFELDAEFLKAEAVFFSADSIDTVAEISINGKKAGTSENAFLRFRTGVKSLLKPGKNTVRILLHSAENAALEKAKKLPYPIPHSVYPVQSPHRNLIRKNQCHAGWDWGPCLMVCGIYGDVSLLATSSVLIEHVYCEQRHSGGKCTLSVHAECNAVREGDYDLTVKTADKTRRRRVHFSSGANTAGINIEVDNPLLWWPNGYGEQPLYDLTVGIGDHSVSKKIGLRTLELVTKKDRFGRSMFFRVNGIDVFCKGANWIPSDALPQRETPQRIEHLISSAAAANMNMLRVWGGGQYESDGFYELCDREGILVWQDLMFSCSLYPSDRGFLSLVDREARYQIKRLRDHPCIALWCGNNENLGALGWFPDAKKNRDRYIVDYDRLYEGVLGKAADECDPTRVYWPSSPCGGRGEYSDNWHEDKKGDMHYWSVWHEGKPFDSYYTVSPRFASEFGYQSFPSMDTIRGYASESDMNVTSPVMEHHQRSPSGNSRITEMFTRYFRLPEGFENHVYLSQVQQATAIKLAVEFWRSLRPVCMGTLYWQLNDNWPVCSWSSVEYSGKWKLLHYAAARFYAPVLLAAYPHGENVEVWIVNDLPRKLSAGVSISVYSFSGAPSMQEEKTLIVPAGTSRLVKSYPRTALTKAPDSEFLHLRLECDGKILSNELFFTEYKRCRLEKADIAVSVSGKEDMTVEISSDKPAFFVSLDAAGSEGEFQDNCFTLLPGEKKRVAFHARGEVSWDDFRSALKIRSLRSSYA